ncbi:alpha-1,4-N-acetylglucosaminyltransferase-like isoform X2 [Protopterus annectens]|uniref:alpha-1,4-N-acetylglucosaminyltransferase-like isoform X2 n=1 Tax=Protopterus annectens TaxID=7888 RepID=UPI001CFC39F6|nr:alpha-1,4-N-acetylglucosaminyltransferase-like isoform X2 [Protopterus annectens]
MQLRFRSKIDRSISVVFCVCCFILLVLYKLRQEFLTQNETYETPNNTLSLHSSSVVFLEADSTFPPQPLTIAAVESAARSYKNRTVYFLLRGLTNRSCLLDSSKYPGLNILTSLQNVKILTLDPELVLDGTPLLSWYKKVTYKNRYWTDFALLAFQFALAWKYGGTFIGTRYISMNPILEQDFVLQKKDLLISNKVFGFTAHNQFVWNCMEDLILHYDRAVWGQHSPNVLTREVNILCDKSAVYLHNRQDSLCDAYNIKLFHHLDFCSISYKTSNLLNHSVTNSFQNQTENDDRQHSTLPVLNKWEDLCLKEYSPIFYRVFMRKKRN